MTTGLQTTMAKVVVFLTSRDNEMNDLKQAISIALDAHTEQTDKADETYIRHPLRVMVQMDTDTERIVAVLHDVVEDSEYNLDQIEERFGVDIRDAVDALTQRDSESYSEFVDRTAENPSTRRVKIADIEDNMDVTHLE